MAYVETADCLVQALTIAFAAASVFTLAALWKTATTDPGLVLHRPEGDKPGEPGYADAVLDFLGLIHHFTVAPLPAVFFFRHRTISWAFDDRTKSWRPVSARYASDCRVIVDEYDHTCPWTVLQESCEQKSMQKTASQKVSRL